MTFKNFKIRPGEAYAVHQCYMSSTTASTEGGVGKAIAHEEFLSHLFLLAANWCIKAEADDYVMFLKNIQKKL